MQVVLFSRSVIAIYSIRRNVKSFFTIQMALGSEHVQQNLKRLQLCEVTRTKRKELGRGSYAAVFEVMVEGTPCAAKEVHPILMSAKSKESFYAECVHSSQLLHPNIIQFMGIHYPSPNAELPWLVMELMYTSLTGLIEQQEKERKDIPFHFKISILVDACQGLQFLHSKNIAHRDLSSNNILLTKHLVAKIADLGMAKVILGDSQKHTLAPGTQIFMPPEALAEDEVGYGITIDVFSVGCVCLHVISMQWPTPKAMKLLDSRTGKVVTLTELQRRETYLPKFQQFPTLKELVCKCLNNFPKERPRVTDVLKGLRPVHWDLACHEKEDIIQLYDSAASYKRMMESDKELTQKSEQLECRENELNEKGKQLDTVQMKMAKQLQQLQTQLTLTCEQLGEAKEKLTVKDAQLAESRQQIEELHSQLLVAAKENDSQDLHGRGGRGPITTALGRFKRIFGGKARNHSNITGTNTNAPQDKKEGLLHSASISNDYLIEDQVASISFMSSSVRNQDEICVSCQPEQPLYEDLNKPSDQTGQVYKQTKMHVDLNTNDNDDELYMYEQTDLDMNDADDKVYELMDRKDSPEYLEMYNMPTRTNEISEQDSPAQNQVHTSTEAVYDDAIGLLDHSNKGYEKMKVGISISDLNAEYMYAVKQDEDTLTQAELYEIPDPDGYKNIKRDKPKTLKEDKKEDEYLELKEFSESQIYSNVQ